MTDSTDPEVVGVKRQFEAILATKPAPIVSGDEAAKPARRKKTRKQ